MRNLFFMMVCFILIMGPGQGWAGEFSPLQISLTPDLQLVSKDKDIRGLRLNLLYGRNNNIYGVDLGIMGSADDLVGIQVNCFLNALTSLSENNPDMTGIQIAGLFNLYGEFEIAKGQSTEMKGIQIAGLTNFTWLDDMTGIQISGLINGIGGDMRGIQVSGINAPDIMTGIQCGLINGGTSVRGIQIGLFNLAHDLVGVQIGLVNYVKKSPVPILPIINMKF